MGKTAQAIVQAATTDKTQLRISRTWSAHDGCQIANWKLWIFDDLSKMLQDFCANTARTGMRNDRADPARTGRRQNWIMAMSNGARRASRRKMGAPAWIRPDEGFSIRKCIISDISSTGVRLFIDEQNLAMKRFSLLMSRNQARGCPCRVKWRRGMEIGAEFLTR